MIFVRNRRFALLWCSQLLSNVGDWLMIVAIPVYVFQLTHSALSTGLVAVAEIVPALVVGPFAGVFVDRWPRRTTMVVSDLLRTGTVLAMLLVNQPGQVWILFLAVFAENVVGQFFYPAHRALLPDIVGRGKDLETANAWYATSSGIVRLAGGAVGGALYLLLSFDALVVIDSATFLVSALLLTLLGRLGPVPSSPSEAAEPADEPDFLREFREGLAYLWHHITLRGLLLVSSLFLLANSMLNVLLVPYVVDTLGAGPEQVGLLMSALGVGYLISAYVGKVASADERVRWSIVLCLLAITGFFAGLFLWHSYVAALVFIGLVGVPGGALLLVVEVQVQRHAPDAVLGRVSSAFGSTEMLATLIGALAGGLIASGAGITFAIVVSLVVLAVTVGGAVLVLPPNRKTAAPDPAAAH